MIVIIGASFWLGLGFGYLIGCLDFKNGLKDDFSKETVQWLKERYQRSLK